VAPDHRKLSNLKAVLFGQPENLGVEYDTVQFLLGEQILGRPGSKDFKPALCVRVADAEIKILNEGIQFG